MSRGLCRCDQLLNAQFTNRLKCVGVQHQAHVPLETTRHDTLSNTLIFA